MAGRARRGAAVFARALRRCSSTSSVWPRDQSLKIIFATPGPRPGHRVRDLPVRGPRADPGHGGDRRRTRRLAAVSLGASGWQMFWHVTLPNIKWGLLYGVILCNARAMGEFGAVYVVSGHIAGQTDTMPLRIEKLFQEYNLPGSFAVASLLTLLALVTLIVKTRLEREAPPRPPPSRRRRSAVMSIAGQRTSPRRFGSFVAARRRQPRGARRRAARAARALRARARRRCCASSPGWRSPTAGQVLFDDEDVTGAQRARAQRRLRLPALRAVPAHDRRSRTSAFGLRVRRARRRRKRRSRPRSTSCSSSSSSKAWATATRRSSPAASASASPWPAPWPREPRVLLLDEPFGALDAKVRQELRHWLRRLHDEIHVTSVFVTHDQEEAFEVADRVVVMNQGTIEQIGTPAGGLRAPRQRRSSWTSSATSTSSTAAWRAGRRCWAPSPWTIPTTRASSRCPRPGTRGRTSWRSGGRRTWTAASGRRCGTSTPRARS